MESGNDGDQESPSEESLGSPGSNRKRKLERTKAATKCRLCHRCMEAVGSHRPVSLKCGHIFGRDCAVDWLKENQFACPDCTTISQEYDLRILFSNTTISDVTVDEDLTQELNIKRRRIEELEQEVDRLRSNRTYPILISFAAASILLNIIQIFQGLFG